MVNIKSSFLCEYLRTEEAVDAPSTALIVNRRRRRGQSKLDVIAVRQIRADGAGVAVNTEQLAKKYGVSVSTIKAVLNRKTWKRVE